MRELKLRRYPPGQFDLLQSALRYATAALSRSERSPAIQACLAGKVLALAVSADGDPLRLSEAALAAMRACLAHCKGCRSDTGETARGSAAAT